MDNLLFLVNSLVDQARIITLFVRFSNVEDHKECMGCMR